MIGISNTLGRIVTGWISDFAWVDSLFVVNCSLVLSASCVFLFPFVATYEMLLVVGALFGLSIAAYISLTSIILVDLLGLERLTSAFGLLTMFRGAASIVGPPLAGHTHQLPPATCLLAHSTCPLPPTTCHLPPATCHLSPVACHLVVQVRYLRPPV